MQGFVASPQVAEPLESCAGQQILQPHLLHQSSGTSMTSSSTEQPTGFRSVGNRKQNSTAPTSPRWVMVSTLLSCDVSGQGHAHIHHMRHLNGERCSICRPSLLLLSNWPHMLRLSCLVSQTASQAGCIQNGCTPHVHTSRVLYAG